MKLQIVDDAGQLYAERQMAIMASHETPEEYLKNIEQNAYLVKGNKMLLLGILGTLQDANVLNAEGVNPDVIDRQVGIATLIEIYKKHTDSADLGSMGSMILGAGKQLSGKAKAVNIDIEYLGELLKKFGDDNSVLIPNIGQYLDNVVNQLREKFGKNGK